MIMKKVLAAFLLFLLIISCTNKQEKTNAFIKTLQPADIGNSGLKISLPPGYEIKEKPGPDFMVYYIRPVDSTRVPEYTGGIYLGQFPTEFSPTGEGCRIDSLRSTLMGSERKWMRLYCDSTYLVQTIIERKDQKLHAFGKGIKEADVQKMLDVFSTLK